MRGMGMVGAIRLGISIVGLVGCEGQVAETRQYAGTSVTSSAPVGKGAVTITNANGSVWVDTAGESGTLSVTGLPFATGPDDAAAGAAGLAALASLKLSVVANGQGGVTVTGNGDDTKGFDLTVHLPYPFDGQLSIGAKNGYVHYVGSSGSKGVTINVESGDVFVQDGGENLSITGGTSNIDVITLPTVTGTSITTNVGDISAQIPNASVLLITATVITGGTVTPPPNKSVELGDDDDDDDDGSGSSGTAVSTVSADHKSATIQLGSLASIQALKQTMQVRTGDGNIVFF